MNLTSRIDQQAASHLKAASQLLIERSGTGQAAAANQLLDPLEQATYDQGNVFRALIEPARWDDASVERAITERAIRRGVARGLGQFLVPFSILCRDFNATGGGAGAALVGTDTSSDVGAWLRGASACVSAGATVLEGLKATVELPYLTGGSTAAIVGEASASGETNPTSGSVELTPYAVTCYVDFSKQFDVQSPSAVAVLANDLRAAVAKVVDAMAINGSGTGEPKGVLNYSGIGDVALGLNGGYLTWDDVAKLESVVETADGTLGPMGFVTSPQIKRGLRKYGAAGELPVWTRSEGRDFVAGTPGFATSNVPINLAKGTSSDCSPLIYGRWSEMFIGFYGAGVEIGVDRITRAADGLNRMTVYALVGIGVRQQACFAAIKDSRIPA